MCAVWSARIHVWRGDLDRATRLMDTFLPRARQHAVIQQVGPALIVAGLIVTASGPSRRGRRVRGGVLRADGRHAGVPAHGDRRRGPPARRRIPNRSRRGRGRQRRDSHLPQRMRVAHRRSHVGAGARRCRARSRSSDRLRTLWRAFGHPLEEYLALVLGDRHRDRSLTPPSSAGQLATEPAPGE